jgi:non-lysosomal glucosylceramidase
MKPAHCPSTPEPTPSQPQPYPANCTGLSCGCPDPGLDRRAFLKFATLGVSAAALAPWKGMAGPFTRDDFEKLVPADKKLSPAWVRSLFERGARTVYRGRDLEKIGMPVGGICAGQIYLGGDGRLWHWDIFNRQISTGAEHYARPMPAGSPLEQGFALWVSQGEKKQVRAFEASGWSDITFTGEYPVGFIEYRDPDSPVSVSLEAFSPFIPLNIEESSLPATVMRFTVRNHGPERVEAELAGWLENAVCLHSGQSRSVLRRNRVVRRGSLTFLECSAEVPPADATQPKRPDILFDDFEREAYETWKAEGTAFGHGPVAKGRVPDYQGDLGLHGQRGVNSHASAPGGDVGAKDAATGTLTSQSFVIERNYITFLVGGGSHQGRTCLNLLVEDKVVATATGADNNRMRPHSWDVRKWAGKSARLQAVDNEKGAWGNVGFDHVIFSDQPRGPEGPLAAEPDFGTMGLALLNAQAGDLANASLPESRVSAGLFSQSMADGLASAAKPFEQKLVGSLTHRLTLMPGESGVVTFVVAWNFPNLRLDPLPRGRHYGTRFNSALAVAEHVAGGFESLRRQTLLWHDTWYDSTLPYWFLDRTFLNTSILATSTCLRFGNGRFWGWEGVGCCHGTCGHVWQYAHALARLFPAVERDTRERVDFGLALQPDGAIFFRAEFNNIPAVDAQAGTVLRALREHQMSPDGAWLKRNWPAVRKSIDWLIAKDANGDGIIEGNQHNTLDTDWFGPVAWLSGLYVAALRAGEEMAIEAGDPAYARRCREIFERGQKNMLARLFEGEYFINKPDLARPDTINSGSGCHIDQVFGQSWAFQVGLGRVLPEKETVSALKALWRYNFTPNVGPFREANKAGRWYAMPGEGGLLMCTFPRTDWDYAKAKGKGADWAAGYFNECMNGFEYQVAGHMIWEGLVMEGLAVTRMLHDRYHPARRNPWNEIECGDHYARSMASYGIFLAAGGFSCHGPKRQLGFSPRLTPENFRCAFTTAEGWGTFSQRIDGGGLKAKVEVKWGRIPLQELTLGLPQNLKPANVSVVMGAKPVTAAVTVKNGAAIVRFGEGVMLGETEALEVLLT